MTPSDTVPPRAELGALLALLMAPALARGFPRIDTEPIRGVVLGVARGGGAPDEGGTMPLQFVIPHGWAGDCTAASGFWRREPSRVRRSPCQLLPASASVVLASEHSGAAAALYKRPTSEGPTAHATALSKSRLKLLGVRFVLAESLPRTEASWQPLTSVSKRTARGGGAPPVALVNPPESGNWTEANFCAKFVGAAGIITIACCNVPRGTVPCGKIPCGKVTCGKVPCGNVQWDTCRILVQPDTPPCWMYGEVT